MAREGSKIVSPGLIGQVLPVAGALEMRVGFTVTKKVGNAVIRNRVRRRLKEAARLVIKDSGVFLGDIVLIGRNQTIDRPFEALKHDVHKIVAAIKEGKGRKR